MIAAAAAGKCPKPFGSSCADRCLRLYARVGFTGRPVISVPGFVHCTELILRIFGYGCTSKRPSTDIGRPPHRLPHLFMCSQPTSCECIMPCGWKEHKERGRERMNRRARQEVGNATLCRSDGRREGEIVVLVGRNLTKWRFVRPKTTRGWDGWRAIRVPLFNSNQDTLHRTPSNLATRRLAFFPPTKELLSSRPNLPLSPSCLLSS